MNTPSVHSRLHSAPPTTNPALPQSSPETKFSVPFSHATLGSPVLQQANPLTSSFNPSAAIPPTIPTPFSHGLPIANTAASLEAKDLAQRNESLQARKQELESFQDQLKELQSSQAEIKKKREEIDAEFKTITEKRNTASIEVSQLRAKYEAEFQFVKDIQDSLVRETRVLEASSLELKQYKDGMKQLLAEKSKLEEHLNGQRTQLSTVKKEIAELSDETNRIREELGTISSESKSLQQHIDVNQKLLESTQNEYKLVKLDLEAGTARLELERKRVAQLEQQASVQEAITIREREKLDQAEKERVKALSRSQDLYASLEHASSKDEPSIPADLSTKKIEKGNHL